MESGKDRRPMVDGQVCRFLVFLVDSGINKGIQVANSTSFVKCKFDSILWVGVMKYRFLVI